MKNLSYTRKTLSLCLTLALVSLIGCGGSGGGGKKSSSSVASSVPASSSSVSVSSSSSVASSVAPAEWTLVWSDEFDEETINPAKWDHEENCWGGGNQEQQCYTDRDVNSFIEDGILNIVAIKEEFTGPNDPGGTGSNNATLPYTSARLRTKNLQEWTFGRFEIRAKLPFGQGTWPAIWMLPTDSPYGLWAAGGEIDIMEAVNLKTQMTVDGVLQPPEANVHGTLHYGRACCGEGTNKNSGDAYALPDGVNPADDFHVYAMEWEDGEIRWYVDGVHFATHRETGWYSQYVVDGVLTDAPVGAPFDDQSEFHLLLNLAVGGSWAANTNNTGIDETVFPQTMQVDYVRVYECSASPTTGKGCATIGEAADLIPGNARPVIGEIEFPGPPSFTFYDDELANGLIFNSYSTAAGQISYSEVDEVSRGKVFNVVKTNTTGNVFFQVNGSPTDLTNWPGDSELVFDFKVNSKATGAELFVKLDSGWPAASDVSVPLGTDGVWIEFRITLADLIDNRNSMNGGTGIADLASISNVFVIEPTAAMNVSFDNVRIEGEEVDPTDYFAPTPLFTMYGDGLTNGLKFNTYTTAAGQIAHSEVDEAGRGKVFNLVKTGTTGNVQFLIDGDASGNFSNWVVAGKLKFDYKVNSKASGATLLVKVDSGWPKASDVSVTDLAVNEWKSFSVDISDLLDNGNSLENPSSNKANINALVIPFVVEPSNTMDISFDNVRFEVE